MVLYNKHYIRTDSENNIIHGFSDAFPDDPRNQVQPDDICIDKQGGRQFEIFGQRIVPFTENGIPASKWNGREAVMRTDEEIQTDIASLPPPVLEPTAAERLAALESAMLAVMMGGAFNG